MQWFEGDIKITIMSSSPSPSNQPWERKGKEERREGR